MLHDHRRVQQGIDLKAAFDLMRDNVVLNELHAHLPVGAKVRYWRTRHGNEIDFVVLRRGKDPIAIECKWSADRADASDLRVFRNHYAGTENYIVAHDVERPREREISGVELTIIGLEDLVRRIAPSAAGPSR